MCKYLIQAIVCLSAVVKLGKLYLFFRSCEYQLFMEGFSAENKDVPILISTLMLIKQGNLLPQIQFVVTLL